MDEVVEILAETFEGPETKTELSVEYVHLDRDGVLAVLDTMKAKRGRTAQLTTVEFGGNHLRAADLEQMFAEGLPLCPKLKELDLRDNRIGEEGWETLEPILVKSCPKIESLDLSENYVKDEGARIAATYLTKAKNLKMLSLGTNQLTPAGMVPLEVGVRLTTTLKILRLEFNAVKDEGCQILLKGLRRNKSIEDLNLSDNSIGNDGAAALAELVSGKNSTMPLLRLDVSVNQIGPSGCSHLVEALRTRTARLQHLDIGCNPIGEEGKKALCSSIGGAHSLLSLDVCSVGLTDEEAQQLTNQVLSPKCRIKKLEWFNNPDMKLETERILYEAVERNAAKSAISPRLLQHPWRRTAVAVAVVVALSAAVAVVAKRRYSSK